MVNVIVDSGRCNMCKLCVEYCPAHVFVIIDGELVVRQENCTECYACIPLCPEKAINIIDNDP